MRVPLARFGRYPEGKTTIPNCRCTVFKSRRYSGAMSRKNRRAYRLMTRVSEDECQPFSTLRSEASIWPPQ
jgi:hypothetical protein